MIRSIYAPILFSLVFGFIGAFIVLFTPANASAASDWDTAYSSVEQLVVSAGQRPAGVPSYMGNYGPDGFVIESAGRYDHFRLPDLRFYYPSFWNDQITASKEVTNGEGVSFRDIADKEVIPRGGIGEAFYHYNTSSGGITQYTDWAGLSEYHKEVFYSFVNGDSQSVSQHCERTYSTYSLSANFCQIIILVCVGDGGVGSSLDWAGAGSRVEFKCDAGNPRHIIIKPSNIDSGTLRYDIRVASSTGAGAPSANETIRTISNNFRDVDQRQISNLYVQVDNLNLPAGYEGELPREANDPVPEKEQLIPEYNWSINGETGELKVVYMKNISPFLTGTSYTVLEGMQPEFESPLTPIDSQSHQPAGWLDYSYTLQPGEGWYSLRIDHNQQLDQPPWEYTESTKPVIQQYFFQIYWDGKSSISGNNIGGCDGQICNNLRDTGSNKLTRFMNQLSFNTFGLESIIILPINYLAQVPSLVDSCQPIHVPFVGGSDFNIPCLRSTYMNAIPVLMGTVFVLINGLVMYLVAINTLRLVKNTADPDHDRIETTDL